MLLLQGPCCVEGQKGLEHTTIVEILARMMEATGTTKPAELALWLGVQQDLMMEVVALSHVPCKLAVRPG